jgi:hypothetical protein
MAGFRRRLVSLVGFVVVVGAITAQRQCREREQTASAALELAKSNSPGRAGGFGGGVDPPADPDQFELAARCLRGPVECRTAQAEFDHLHPAK